MRLLVCRGGRGKLCGAARAGVIVVMRLLRRAVRWSARLVEPDMNFEHGVALDHVCAP